MSLAIASMGTAVPTTTLDQHEGLALARALASPTEAQDTWLPAIYSGTTIQKRYTVLPAQLVRDVVEGTRTSESVFLPSGTPQEQGPTTAQRMEHYARLAPPLALQAVRRALGMRSPEEITHLITVSCTGFVAPGLDRWLVQQLGLQRTVERTHVGYMGCHGALNGLRVAHGFTSMCDPQTCVLLCAVELCSLHYYYGWHPSKMVANALFADGAAALVGVPNPRTTKTSETPECWHLLASGAYYFPHSEQAMTWTIADHGFEMSLAKNVPGLIARELRPWLTAWLARQGVGLEQVGSWAIHPGGPRILEAVQQGLELTDEALRPSREVFVQYGNMSSPTVLFILDRLRQQQAKRPCVALGFGPGLAAEAALFG